MFFDSTHKYYKTMRNLKDILFKEEQKHFVRCKKIKDLIISILNEDCNVCIYYNNNRLCNKGMYTCMKNTTKSQFVINVKKIETESRI